MKNTKTNNEKVTDSSGENLAPIQFLVQQTTQTNQVLDNATMQIAADNVRIPMAELKVQWGHPWNDVFECNDILLEDWINLGVDTQTGVVLSAEYLTSRGYTSDKLVRAGVHPQDLIATAGVNRNLTENIIGPDALKIYEKFNTQIPQRPLKFKYTETTTNPTTKVKTIVRSTKISVPVNIVKKIAEYLTPVKSDTIFGTDIMCNIRPQNLEGVHSEWLKLLNSDQAQKLALRDSILIPQYNSTASLFKDNLANLKEKINLKQNPIESICHALAANNKFSEYEQQEKNNKFEPLLDIALKTTYFVAPDSAQIENARYKTIVEKSNKLKALLENDASEEEIQLYLDQNNDIAINIADAAGDMILHNLMGIGYEDKTVEKLKALIKYGGDINAQNAKGETPVHWAAYWVPVYYVEILTEHKNFNSTLKTLYGQTPIHYFVDAAKEEDASEHADTIIFLTKAGYKITKEKDINGWTAIDKAYLYHAPMIELENELLETVRGLDNYLNETQYGYTNNGGDTRLHRLAELTPEEGRSAVFIYDILNNGINDINVKNSKGETPLHLAITNENIVNIIVLICSGANLFLKDNNNENSLDLLNKWPEAKLIDLFNTNAPVKSRIQEKINEFTEQNPNNDTYQGLD